MIYISNNQNKVEFTTELEKHLEKVVEHTLTEEGVSISCELSIVLVDNDEIRGLNEEHRNIDKATDVLSFPMLDFPEGKVYKDVYKDKKIDRIYFDGEELVLGDMVLSLEKALEQSIEYGHSFEREVAYLTVHSILHLLGYDHMEVDEKLKMREREEIILNKLGISRG